MRRTLKTLLFLLLALELAYLAVVNVGGLVAPRLLSRHPEIASAEFKVFSPFPGLVYVWDFDIRVQDRLSQWQLQVDECGLRTFRAAALGFR